MKVASESIIGHGSAYGRRWLLLLLLTVATVCSAATSPVGRPLKFYETSALRVVRFGMPGESCVPIQVVVCMPLSSGGSGSFPSVEIAAVVVSPSAGRSMLCANPTAQAIYAFANRSTGGDDISTFKVDYRYELQSTVLTDPSLINPRTGMPFDGKIALSPASMFTDQSYLGPQQRIVRSQRIGSLECAIPLITHSMLVSNYGLSSTDAQRVMGQSMTVRLFISADLIVTDGGSYTVQLRMMGD